MTVAGTYAITVKTPMGEQKGTLTVNPDGAAFSGAVTVDMMGSMEIADGKVDGDALAWTMQMNVPMPMSLDCEAIVAGDAITGTVKAGTFGTFNLTGTRE